MMPAAPSLAGARVLVVEDELMIARLIGRTLVRAGATLVGPFPRIDLALAAVRAGGFDLAVLDVNLAGERIDPVADALAALGTPFLFLTGYGTPGVEGWARPVLAKPFEAATLIARLAGLWQPGG